MVIKFANHLVDGGGKGPRAWQMEIRDTRSFFIVSTANEAYTDINNIAMQKGFLEGYFCRHAFLLWILYFVNPKKHMSII
jgi:hypothetical protein